MIIKKSMMMGAVVLATFCLLIGGQAAEVSTQKTLKPAQPAVQAQPSPTPQTLLPDLVVEKIWLDGRNHVVLRLKNAGKGPVSDASHAKGW
jgi:hypothetical protein